MRAGTDEQRAGVIENQANADRFAANILPVIHDIERAGVTTLQRIAEALNARGIRTARGGNGTHIANALEKLDERYRLNKKPA